jgi:NAD-dependent DNA ligase
MGEVMPDVLIFCYLLAFVATVVGVLFPSEFTGLAKGKTPKRMTMFKIGCSLQAFTLSIISFPLIGPKSDIGVFVFFVVVCILLVRSSIKDLNSLQFELETEQKIHSDKIKSIEKENTILNNEIIRLRELIAADNINYQNINSAGAENSALELATIKSENAALKQDIKLLNIENERLRTQKSNDVNSAKEKAELIINAARAEAENIRKNAVRTDGYNGAIAQPSSAQGTVTVQSSVDAPIKTEDAPDADADADADAFDDKPYLDIDKQRHQDRRPLSTIEFTYKNSKDEISRRVVYVRVVEENSISGICQGSSDYKKFLMSGIIGDIVDQATGEIVEPLTFYDDYKTAVSAWKDENQKKPNRRSDQDKYEPLILPNENYFDDLDKKQICFTGFGMVDRDAYENFVVEATGMVVRKGITKKLDYLCIGPNAGPEKLKKAKEQGVTIITEQELHQLFSTDRMLGMLK